MLDVSINKNLNFHSAWSSSIYSVITLSFQNSLWTRQTLRNSHLTKKSMEPEPHFFPISETQKF